MTLRAALIAVLALLAAAPSGGAAYRFAGAWGGEGSASGMFGTGRQLVGGDRQFNSPGGIAVDRAGNVFVADTSNNRIQRFTAEGRFLGSFGRYGFDPGAKKRVAARGRFILPQGTAISSAGHLFVADNRNDRVVKLTRSGRFLRRIGRRGAIRATMTSPWGLAVRGNIVYVVDQGNTRIQRWATNGRYLGAFGRFGTQPGQFRALYGIAVSRHVIFVSETGRDQVDRYTRGGRYVGSIGGPGSAPGRFNQPAGLALDAQGNLLVADCANQRVQRLTPTGEYIESFGNGHLRDPTFLAVGRGGAVYVSDYRHVAAFVPSDEPDDFADIVGALLGDYAGYLDTVDGLDDLVEPPGRLACVSQAEGASQ